MSGPTQEPRDAMHEFFKENWNLNDEEAQQVVDSMHYPNSNLPIPSPRPMGEWAGYHEPVNVKEALPLPLLKSGLDAGKTISTIPGENYRPIPTSSAIEEEKEKLRQYSMEQRMARKDAEIAQGVRDAEHAQVMSHLEELHNMQKMRHDANASMMADIFGLYSNIPLGQLAQPKALISNPQVQQSLTTQIQGSSPFDPYSTKLSPKSRP